MRELIMKCVNKFSAEYLMERDGITEEEATYIVKTRRKMCKEYWISRGYSEEDALIEIQKFQSNAAKKAAEAKRNNPENTNNTCIEYYINKGMTEEEALSALKKRQSTFSLEKCIEKYGLEEGTAIFNARQKKWQDTLKKHDKSYILEMNKKKNVKNRFIEKYGEDEGLKKWNELNLKRKQKCSNNFKEKQTGEWFFKKYQDKTEAQKQWEEWKNQPKRFTYEWYLYKTKDETLAKIEYEKYLEIICKRTARLKSQEYLMEKYGENWEEILCKKNKIGRASKESLKLFIPLYKILRKTYQYNLYDILFGISGLKEFLIYDKKTNTRKLYDFTILSDKIIFEFNGDGKYLKEPKNNNHLLKSVHPNYIKLSEEELLKWVHIKDKNLTAKEKIQEDLNKINIAKEKGFNVLVLWQSDGIEYNLNKCLEFINEVRNKNKRYC